jgi:hypothetical protein
VINFSPAQAKALFTAVRSLAQQLGIFQAIDTHEPENAPGNRLYCSITLGGIGPAPSGLNILSGQVTLLVRIWSAAMQRPLDDIDPEALATIAAFIGALAGAFTLGGTVRNIKIADLTATPGWIQAEGKPFRVVEMPVPIVINDMWAEVA